MRRWGDDGRFVDGYRYSLTHKAGAIRGQVSILQPAPPSPRQKHFAPVVGGYACSFPAFDENGNFARSWAICSAFLRVPASLTDPVSQDLRVLCNIHKVRACVIDILNLIVLNIHGFENHYIHVYLNTCASFRYRCDQGFVFVYNSYFNLYV